MTTTPKKSNKIKIKIGKTIEIIIINNSLMLLILAHKTHLREHTVY